eukprot:945604-Rhodomonas_salina.1
MPTCPQHQYDAEALICPRDDLSSWDIDHGHPRHPLSGSKPLPRELPCDAQFQSRVGMFTGGVCVVCVLQLICHVLHTHTACEHALADVRNALLKERRACICDARGAEPAHTA